ncbi:FecR family protein [Pedobacter psychrotolerans]|uniref:FecR family protein n=1 Tax=Pedobacter psychrotolerans TaxID=1843235 RepID=A0A4R2HIW2_9SPHI|nr:FecR family protein [Pedobacter psychrotolerans]TCO28869.1 FecR family protein [Pedobacter psychrotolerans]GGE52456.1 iron dicitrate transporter FecR [Pedobacter psychrotolerans]
MSQHKNQKALKSVLKKYLNEKASPKECEAVNLWYEELGKETETVAHLNQADAINNLGRAIKSNLLQKTSAQRKSKLQLHHIKYAALFLVVLSAGLIFYQHYSAGKIPESALTFKSGNLAAKEITLKDGSVILLNVGSELIVAKNFGLHERNVSLKGEAFFKISKDKRKPFIIKSGTLKTTVVGTSFNINAYPDLDKIKIAVASGKVKVSKTTSNGEQNLANGMTKDASLTFEKSTGKTTLKTEDAALIASWKDNKLYIDNATISEIAKQLERYYHLKVVYNRNIDKGKRYTIRFNQEPANRVMEILSILTKTKFTYQTNQITIK